MADITAIILTKNEEANIQKCIRSIKPIVKRIVVVDSGSTDETVSIATGLGAQVLVNEMKPFLYAKQFLYGMEHAGIDTKWVFRIDADEELTEESAKEIETLCNENEDTDVNGIVVRFEVNFMGRAIRHGGVYPLRKLLLFKYGKGTIEDRCMDEHCILFEGRSVEVAHDSLHHDDKGLSAWIDKHNNYSTREMMDYFNSRGADAEEATGMQKLDSKARFKRFLRWKIYYRLPAGFRAYAYYFYRYYVRLGFLDGREGKIFCFMQAYWYRFLVDAKIYEARQGDGSSVLSRSE
ncbi:MAG: glycosyltransferase family 2 protein [Lachnospiraceae bacterium]|nr:glycosyltransferase family 2 protein [Lachnospiraceae bacterium]